MTRRPPAPRLMPVLLLLGLAAAGGDARAATGSAARQAVLAHYLAQARRVDPHFAGFSAAKGRAFFLAHPGTGHPDTPSCSTCHSRSPLNWGRTPVGKRIAPMAVSRTPARFTSLHKVRTWFRRNCHIVYGRYCTAAEKGNYIAFMASQ